MPLRHFITFPDYAKMIKMQSLRTAPYIKAIDIKRNPKKMQVSSFPKVKRLGKRK